MTRIQWQLLNVLARGVSTLEQLDEAIRPSLGATNPDETSAEHLTELIESAWVDATPTGYEMTERGRTAFGTLSDERLRSSKTIAIVRRTSPSRNASCHDASEAARRESIPAPGPTAVSPAASC